MASEGLDSESAMDSPRLDSASQVGSDGQDSELEAEQDSKSHMGSDGQDAESEAERDQAYVGTIQGYQHVPDKGFIECSELADDVHFCSSDLPSDFSAGRDGFCVLIGFDVTFRLHDTSDDRLQAKQIQVLATKGRPLMGIVTSVSPEKDYGLITSSAVKGDVHFGIKEVYQSLHSLVLPKLPPQMLVGRHVRFMVHDKKDGDKQKAVACAFKPVTVPAMQSQMMQLVNRMTGNVGAMARAAVHTMDTKTVVPPPAKAAVHTMDIKTVVPPPPKAAVPTMGIKTVVPPPAKAAVHTMDTKTVVPPPVTQSEATEAESREMPPLPADGWWICPKCNFQNHEFDLDCQNCGAPWSQEAIESSSSEQPTLASTPPVGRLRVWPPTPASTPAPVGKGGQHIPLVQLGWSIAKLRSEMTAMVEQNQENVAAPGKEATGEKLDPLSSAGESCDPHEVSGTEATGEMLDDPSIEEQSWEDYEDDYEYDYEDDYDDDYYVEPETLEETLPYFAEEWWTCPQCKVTNHEFDLWCEKCEAPWSAEFPMHTGGQQDQQYDGTIRIMEQYHGFISCSELQGDIYFGWQDLPPDFSQGRDGFCDVSGFNVTFRLRETFDGKLRAKFVQVVATEGKPLMGIIKLFFPEKGYGFIISSAVKGDVFFLKSQMPPQIFTNMLIGRHVRFELIYEDNNPEKRKAVSCAVKPLPAVQGDGYIKQALTMMQMFNQMKGKGGAAQVMAGMQMFNQMTGKDGAPGKAASPGSLISPTNPGAQSQYGQSKTVDPALAQKSESAQAPHPANVSLTGSAAASSSSEGSKPSFTSAPVQTGIENGQQKLQMMYANLKKMMHQVKANDVAPGKAASPGMFGATGNLATQSYDQNQKFDNQAPKTPPGGPPNAKDLMNHAKDLMKNEWAPAVREYKKTQKKGMHPPDNRRTAPADNDRMAPPPGDWTSPAYNKETRPPSDGWWDPQADSWWKPADDKRAPPPPPPGDWRTPADDRREPPPGIWGTAAEDRRPPPPPPPGDWGTQSAVGGERMPPPGDFRMPSADDWWICTQCNFRNREYDPKCVRCQAPWPKRPRPSSASSDKPRLPVKPPAGPPPARLLVPTPPPPPPAPSRSQKELRDGIVKMLNPKGQYGFLTSPGVSADISFNFEDVIGGVDLSAGQPISFNLLHQEDGRPVATDIKLIKFR